MTVTVDILQRLPLLSALPRVTLSELSKVSELKSFNKREVVVSKGTQPQHLLFLLDGRLQGVDFTMDGKEVGVFFTQPGDFFGELAVMDQEPHPETIIAIAKSTVVAVPRLSIRPLLLAMPALAEALTLRLASKLRLASTQRRILGLTNPTQKVCAQLWTMLPTGPAVGQQPATISQMPTHQELAIMVNASRETVTRVFQQLLLKSVVKRDGNDLIVVNPQLLKHLSEGQTSLDT
jgi:CRP-like cAMP-binding protein